MRFIALLFVIFLSFTGCASLFNSKPAKTPAEERKDFLDKYEKSFNPAEYDEVEDTVNERLSGKNKNLISAHDAEAKELELVSGFRVQLLFTPEIDEANNIKNGVTPLVKEAVYVKFEAPYYKVRVGDCQNRLTANQLLKTLVDLGYKNAWIVPDKVHKNPQKPKDNAAPLDNY
jgi:hypothetical protein